ncbi:class I SAM-dependent methyltransferase [Luteolibacter marinus]|uniref:class I SAM-dependent methyltransferase n=1 Tax=Luteolibacter marinus TaxID=2776705 RepID=UPI0018689578|nr:class I SAM-dependent methyltransferase [Luteolibacter marinus]
MDKEQIKAVFDQQASTYDEKWKGLAAINGALHLLTGAVLAELPEEARILCVGAGTGAELLYLAGRFPGWRFTAVEPSAAMLDVLRARAEEQGIAGRCVFHEGYLESLPAGEPFHAATSVLVSQFIQDRAERAGFFREIAARLVREGVLVSADLACDFATEEGRSLLGTWFRLMKGGGVSAEEVERMRGAYERDVAVLPREGVPAIVMEGGFGVPVPFFQAGMIHAWYARVGG